MNECCTSSGKPVTPPGKHRCPVNGREYSSVSVITILHHISRPWRWKNKKQGYYFCDDPACDVVYFGQDDSIIVKDQLRTRVGVKERSDSSLVCYCFGVNYHEAAADPVVRDFVIRQTKERTCACEIRNPSGKCCLKDFPKQEKD